MTPVRVADGTRQDCQGPSDAGRGRDLPASRRRGRRRLQQRLGERVPGEILDRDQRWISELCHLLAARAAAFDQDGNLDLTVGIVGIASGVAAVERGADAGDLVY